MKVDETYLLIDATRPEQSGSQIRIGAFQRRSLVAGPGVRAVIWVAGCNRRCPGCIKPEFLSFDAGSYYTVDALETMVLDCTGIDGVTYSGGEPFEQATGLGELSRRLRLNGFNVLSYSGYRLEALKAQQDRFGPLLSQLDWLIDGEYVAQEPGPYQYLGSANQTLYKLEAERAFVPVVTPRRQEIQLSVSGESVRVSGFPDPESHRLLEEALRRRGIVLEEFREKRKP